MLKKIVEPGDTWASLAYNYLGASSKFKEILDVNPQYHELSQPNVGDVIIIPDSVDIETDNRTLDFIIDQIPNLDQNIYPWTNLGNYLNRLSQYHPMALLNIEDCNGDSLDAATPPYVPSDVEIRNENSSFSVDFSLL